MKTPKHRTRTQNMRHDKNTRLSLVFPSCFLSCHSSCDGGLLTPVPPATHDSTSVRFHAPNSLCCGEARTRACQNAEERWRGQQGAPATMNWCLCVFFSVCLLLCVSSSLCVFSVSIWIPVLNSTQQPTCRAPGCTHAGGGAAFPPRPGCCAAPRGGREPRYPKKMLLLPLLRLLLLLLLLLLLWLHLATI